MPPIRSLLLLVALFSAACASAGTLPPVPAPAELPDLETAVMEDPDDVLSGLRLASGYRAAGRIEEAGALVTQLTIEHPGTLSGLVSFSTLTFATAPTPGVGYYMRVADTDPATLPLAIEVLLSSPRAGQLLSLVSGGATLLW